jgi:hypothetical protein
VCVVDGFRGSGGDIVRRVVVQGYEVQQVVGCWWATGWSGWSGGGSLGWCVFFFFFSFSFIRARRWRGTCRRLLERAFALRVDTQATRWTPFITLLQSSESAKSLPRLLIQESNTLTCRLLLFPSAPIHSHIPTGICTAQTHHCTHPARDFLWLRRSIPDCFPLAS